ncbi:MAG: acylphosphatase, partial [Cyclobacteriaceae bacterium]
MKQHFNITVQGRVQGVFYRASTKQKALELGLVGWVCNRSDGSVYLEAEGSKEQLNTLLAWCKK